MEKSKTLREHLSELGREGARAQRRTATKKQLSDWGKKGAKSRWAAKK